MFRKDRIRPKLLLNYRRIISLNANLVCCCSSLYLPTLLPCFFIISLDMQAILTVAALSTASAFVAQSAKGSSALAGVRSKSVPFLEQPAALDGTLAGDVGFDPLGLSSKWSDVS